MTVELRDGEGDSSLVWSAIPGAAAYNVMRGRLQEAAAAGPFTVITDAVCMERETAATSLSGGLLEADPAPGEAYLYLVEYVKGGASGYGTEASGRELIVGSGDACH